MMCDRCKKNKSGLILLSWDDRPTMVLCNDCVDAVKNESGQERPIQSEQPYSQE